LIVVEEAAHGRTIVEHHRPGRIGGGRCRRPVRRPHALRRGSLGVDARTVLGGLDALPLEHGLFDLPKAPDLLSHLDLGVAVGLQDGLGHVAEVMHRPNAIGALRTTMVIPFRSTARRFIPHLSNRSWPEGQ
jgi:hypothetical protein